MEEDSDVTPALIARPLGPPFLEPTVPEKRKSSDSRHRIRRSMDFRAIERKCENDEYANWNEWVADLQVVIDDYLGPIPRIALLR
jgi:hypothetical protein